MGGRGGREEIACSDRRREKEEGRAEGRDGVSRAVRLRVRRLLGRPAPPVHPTVRPALRPAPPLRAGAPRHPVWWRERTGALIVFHPVAPREQYDWAMHTNHFHNSKFVFGDVRRACRRRSQVSGGLAPAGGQPAGPF